MIISRIKLPVAKLQAMNEPDRSYFIRLGAFLNEIKILHKLVYWSVSTPTTHEVEDRAHQCQTLFITKLLCGKLYEGRKLLPLGHKFIDRCPADGIDALRNLKEYFADNNLVATIRNQFAFHSDDEPIREVTSSFPLNEDYEFLLTSKDHSSLYFAADVVTNTAFLAAVDPTNVEAAMEKLIDEFGKVYRWFRDFGGEVIYVMTREYFPESLIDSGVEKVNLPGQRMLDEIPFPFFVEIEA